MTVSRDTPDLKDATTTELSASSIRAIRRSVAKMYRQTRRFEDVYQAARAERAGWAINLADEYAATGTVDPVTAYFYTVACEYSAAAERIVNRQVARSVAASSAGVS